MPDASVGRRRLVLLASALLLCSCGTTVPNVTSTGSAAGSEGSGAQPSAALGGDVAGGGGSPALDRSGTSPATSPLGPAAVGNDVAVPDSPVVTPTGPLRPLQLGVLVGDFSAAARKYGFITSPDEYTGVDYAKALVKYYNDRGGLAGHKLSMVDYSWSTASDKYVQDGELACAKFTQDNKVDFVMANWAAVQPDNFKTCLRGAKVAAVDAAYSPGSASMVRKYPNYLVFTGPSSERRLTAMIKGGLAVGDLQRGMKVGVLVESCPGNAEAYERAMVPLARANDLTLDRFDVNCAYTSGGVAEALDSWQRAVSSAMLRWSTNGVKAITFVTDNEQLAMAFMPKQGNSQQYYPLYLISSACSCARNSGDFDGAGPVKVSGVGWMPLFDVTDPPAVSPAESSCRTLLVSLKFPPDRGTFNVVCGWFWLLRTALEKIGGGPVTDVSIAAAIRSLGTSYVSTTSLSGQDIWSSTLTGPRLFASFRRDPSNGVFRYTSAPLPLA